MIERKVTLESFTSRVSGLGRYIGQVSGMTSSGNWGKIPYAIDFSKINGSMEQLYLKKDNTESYYKYKGTRDEMSSAFTYYYKSINGDYTEYQKYVEDNYSLISKLGITSYRDMMDAFYIVRNIYENTKYYTKFKKRGVLKWNEYEPFILEYTNINIYNSFESVTDSAETKIGIYTGNKIYSIKSKRTFIFNNSARGEINNNSDETDVWACFGGDYNLFMKQYYNIMMRYFGNIKVPDSLIKEDNKVPLLISVSGIEDYINNLERYRKSNDCCISKKYEEYGGAEMKAFLENVLEKAQEDKESFFSLTLARSGDSETDYTLIDATDEYYEYIPKLSLPVLLTKDSDSTGIDDVTEEVTRKTLQKKIRKVVDGESYLDEEDDETVFVEISANTENGKLYTLRTSRKTCDDSGNELPFNIVGFSKNNNGEINFKITDIFCSGQPMNIKTVLDESGQTKSIYGDVITEINLNQPSSGQAEFHYVLNAELNKSSGGYWEPKVTDINGIYYVESIPFSENEFNIKYEGVQLSGTARSFTVSYNNSAIMSFFVKKYPFYSETISYNSDVFFGVYETPSISSDISLDKGNASAFELHMKLGEINTFEDLKNYHNNEFGL